MILCYVPSIDHRLTSLNMHWQTFVCKNAPRSNSAYTYLTSLGYKTTSSGVYTCSLVPRHCTYTLTRIYSRQHNKLDRVHYGSLERLARDKHSSLLDPYVSYGMLWVRSLMPEPGKPNWRRRLSTVDLLVLTSLDQLLLYWKYNLCFFLKPT
jgi:hypothetical protein